MKQNELFAYLYFEKLRDLKLSFMALNRSVFDNQLIYWYLKNWRPKKMFKNQNNFTFFCIGKLIVLKLALLL